VGSVAARAALGQVSPSTSVSFATHSFHYFFHNFHYLSNMSGTIRQQMATVILDLVLLQPHRQTNKKLDIVDEIVIQETLRVTCAPGNDLTTKFGF
jgi:hypothetical protein